MYTATCNLCGSSELSEVIDLGYHPVADTFIQKTLLDAPETRYPLRVNLCQVCGYAFLDVIVSGEKRYQEVDYSYTSSNSPVSVEHFNQVAHEVVDFLKLKPGDLAIDVGSNVGTLLKAMQEKSGCSVLGVDPAPNMVKVAIEDGVPSLCAFFDQAAVPEIVKYGRARVVASTNALNHASDVKAFVAPLKEVLQPDGVFVFEVPYLLDLVEKTAFDTIYLEHVSYFGIRALKYLFEQFGYQIIRIERTEYMGGSIRVYVGSGVEAAEVQKCIDAEHAAGLYEQATYHQFMNRIRALRFDLCEQLYKAKRAGKRIIGVGAATKGNTLLNYCKIDSELLDFITDSSPFKIGKYTPGSHIVIKPDEAIDGTIDSALILPWNIADYLKKKLSHTSLEFIVPHTK